MVEDAKAARDRRLAEALRANLKRRKAAKTAKDEATASEAAAAPSGHPQPVEGDS